MHKVTFNIRAKGLAVLFITVFAAAVGVGLLVFPHTRELDVTYSTISPFVDRVLSPGQTVRIPLGGGTYSLRLGESLVLAVQSTGAVVVRIIYTDGSEQSFNYLPANSPQEPRLRSESAGLAKYPLTQIPEFVEFRNRTQAQEQLTYGLQVRTSYGVVERPYAYIGVVLLAVATVLVAVWYSRYG